MRCAYLCVPVCVCVRERGGRGGWGGGWEGRAFLCLCASVSMYLSAANGNVLLCHYGSSVEEERHLLYFTPTILCL